MEPLTPTTLTCNIDANNLEDNWKALLQRIKPVYSNPYAKRIADILKAQMNGEDVTDRKVQMLTDMAVTDYTEDYYTEDYYTEEDEDAMYNESDEYDDLDITVQPHQQLYFND